MLDKVRLAVAEGKRVALVYCDRTEQLVKLEPIEGCDTFRRSVSYRGVELRRALQLPKLAWWLRRTILRNTDRGCLIHTDSIDMLAIAQLGAIGLNTHFHHQVRDLHSLQLGKGALPRLVRFVDRTLMRRISMLMVTCQGYYDRYYSQFYDGNYVVVENWPDLESWDGFRRQKSDELVIGFVGVVRYLECLKALIRAIDSLQERGHKIRLRLAGGGDTQRLLDEVGQREWIDVYGAFSYRDEIKQLYSDVDIIWSVYDVRIKNVRVAMPNKFYESVLSGIPIVVAEGTYLSERVEEIGIGTSVPGTDAKAIASKLKDACTQSGWYEDAELQAIRQKPKFQSYLKNEHRHRIRQAVLGIECETEQLTDVSTLRPAA